MHANNFQHSTTDSVLFFFFIPFVSVVAVFFLLFLSGWMDLLCVCVCVFWFLFWIDFVFGGLFFLIVIRRYWFGSFFSAGTLFGVYIFFVSFVQSFKRTKFIKHKLTPRQSSSRERERGSKNVRFDLVRRAWRHHQNQRDTFSFSLALFALCYF